MTEAPNHVRGLAEQRAKARAERDFAAADLLRQEIEAAGWLVRDAAEGFELEPKPPFTVWPTVRSLPRSARGSGGSAIVSVTEHAARWPEAEPGPDDERVGTENAIASQVLWDSTLAASRLDEAISGAATAQRHTEVPSPVVTVALLIDGYPSDVRKCVDALIIYSDAKIIALDLGDIDGAGVVVHELAERHPGRIEAWHVAERPHWRGGSAGWGTSRNKLLELDDGDVHVVMETSTTLDGDAITPLVAAIGNDVVAAGWKGVDPGGDGRDWHEAGPGPVRALLGYLIAVRRDQALKVGGFPEKARYYRNADLEFSLLLPGKVVVPDQQLPVHQERHRGYHEADAEYRDRESRRTYDRVLRLLRADGNGGRSV